jgi:hypothetical protein
MFRNLVAGLILAMSSVAGSAQQIDNSKVETLARCLIDNSTDLETSTVRKMMVAALQDDLTTLRTSIVDLGSQMGKIAMNSCGVGLSQLGDPIFQEAGKRYGEILGERIMTEAFAKLN